MTANLGTANLGTANLGTANLGTANLGTPNLGRVRPTGCDCPPGPKFCEFSVLDDEIGARVSRLGVPRWAAVE